MNKQSKHKLDLLNNSYYSSGFLFMVPYVLIYLSSWFFKINTETTKLYFIFLHSTTLALFVVFLFKHFQSQFFWDWLFWLSLFVIFLAPGPFLEYPADTWEHFRRIFSWENAPSISEMADKSVRNRFAYFWGWTTMSWLDIPLRRTALGIYAAFWQFLLSWQFFLLVRKLKFSKPLAHINVFAFIFLFGTNVFSFRYYALSSTPLAFIAYFASIIILLSALAGKTGKKHIGILLMLLLIMAVNHVQELYLFTICAPLVIGYHFFQKLSQERRIIAIISLVSIYILGFALGCFLNKYYVGDNAVYIASRYTFWGAHKIWNATYIDTLGVHGILGIIFSFIWFSKYPIPSLLIISPVILLTFPPAVAMIEKFLPNPHSSYRVFYLFPSSVMLVAGLYEICLFFQKKTARLRTDFSCYLLTCFLVLILSLPIRSPWRGRFFFQLHKPSPERSLLAIDQTAAWFKHHRPEKHNCEIISDYPTHFSIYAHLGWSPVGGRRKPFIYSHTLTSPAKIFDFLEHHKVCGFLVGIKSKIPRPPPSPIAKNSSHWFGWSSDQEALTSEWFLRSAEFLLERKWTKTEVPPFFYYYEPPKTK